MYIFMIHQIYSLCTSNVCLAENCSFDYVVRAASHHLFTSAIPLLHSAGTFACCVSALGRYVPHYPTW